MNDEQEFKKENEYDLDDGLVESKENWVSFVIKFRPQA